MRRKRGRVGGRKGNSFAHKGHLRWASKTGPPEQEVEVEMFRRTHDEQVPVAKADSLRVRTRFPEAEWELGLIRAPAISGIKSQVRNANQIQQAMKLTGEGVLWLARHGEGEIRAVFRDKRILTGCIGGEEVDSPWFSN